MSRWEYQVIHLNVEDSSKASQAPEPGPAAAQQPATPPAAAPPPIAGQPVFSKAYLEQEFPDFYSNPTSQPPQQPPQGQQQPNHPALQLQQFLNGHGQQGWSLVGIYPLGSLLMMFFRRRIPEPAAEPIPAAAPIAQPPPPTPAAAAPIPPSAPPEGHERADFGTPPVTDWLQQIMQRLDSLEGRIATPPSDQTSSEQVSGPPVTPAAGAPGQAEILSANHVASLQEEGGMPTFHAAKALDFRSYASLAGYGSRHGYPLGLVKEGANQMAAVYIGLEQGDRGGRARRLWAVVPVARLRAFEG